LERNYGTLVDGQTVVLAPKRVKSLIRGGTTQDKRAALAYGLARCEEIGHIATPEALEVKRESAERHNRIMNDLVKEFMDDPESETGKMIGALINSPLAKKRR
jgi:hypothetical protein